MPSLNGLPFESRFPRGAAALALALALAPSIRAQGRALQLYSAYTANPPKINGNLTDRTNGAGSTVSGTDNDEWKDAFVRTVTLKTADGSDSISATLFLMNDDTTLYAGMTANFSNSSAGTYMAMYFDQGAGGGNGDGTLQGGGAGINNGEYYAKVFPNNGTREEGSFDGTNWVANGRGAVFSGAGKNFGTSFVQSEFKIPLNHNPAADDANSYLNVQNGQNLGLFLETFIQGGNKTYYWSATNENRGNPAPAPGWGALRLGVRRSFLTFYSSTAANGDPTVDGNISGDDAWRGAYRRDILLTDFAGRTLPATLYSAENATTKNIYVGLKVRDSTQDGGDYAQIYQEQSYAATPASGRDYTLDNGKENALKANTSAFALANDLHWNGGGPGWAGDAAITGQGGIGQYKSGAYEYEFQINRQGDAQDLNLAANAKAGFTLRYHDAHGSGDDFYWEYAPNSEFVLLDKNSTIYTSIGWADFQLGAPYAQVVFPEDDAQVEGLVNLRVYAQGAAGAGDITAVKYFRAADTTSKTDLTRIAATGEWGGTWNASSLADGADTLIFRVTNAAGITLDRMVPVTISNRGGAALPTVSITAPTPGSEVSGTVSVTFAATAGSGTVAATEISVDGGAYGATTTAASHNWNTAALADGNHTVQVRVTNSNGAATASQVTTYAVRNAPGVSLTTPAAGATLTGRAPLAYAAAPRGAAAIASESLYVDGKAYMVLAASGADTLNTLPLLDGQHSLQVKATDANGKIGLSALILATIRNRPTVAWTAPAGGSTVSGRLPIAYAASAAAPDSLVAETLFVDGRPDRAVKLSGQDTLNTTLWPDAEHQFQIKVLTATGKTALSQAVILLVRNAPTAAWVHPSGGDTVSGNLPLAYTAAAVAPDSIVADTLLLDGRAYRALSRSGADTLNTTALADAEHTLQVMAVDGQGRTALSKAILVLVRNAPSIRLLTRLADSTVSGRLNLAFAAAAVAPAKVDSTFYALDGGDWQVTATDSTAILDTRPMSEGAHILRLKVRDSQGKSAESGAVKFNLRNSPTVALLAPAEASLLRGTVTVRFRARAVAPDTIRLNEIAIAGGPWKPAGDSAYAFDTRGYPDGAVTLQIRSTDGSGKAGTSAAIALQIDNSAPKVSMPSVRYPDGSNLGKRGAPMVVSAQALDFIAGMDKDSAMVLYAAGLGAGAQALVMHDDGKDGDLVAGDNVFSAAVAVASDSSGLVPYSIRARDALGNDTTLRSAVALDNIAPRAAFTLEPKALHGADSLHGEVYAARVVVKGTFGDSGGSGMAFANVAVVNDSGAHVNTSPAGIPLDKGTFSRVIELVPGRNRILLVTGDRAGNVDTAAAELTYIEPKATVMVAPGKPAELWGADSTGVSLPADALYRPTEISVRPADPAAEPKPLDSRLKLLGVPHEFGPDKTVFRQPVLLTLSYTDADLDKDQDGIPDLDPAKLSVVFWDGSSWIRAGEATRDPDHHRVSVAVNHFTLYDLAQDTAPAPTQLVAYWNRNPVRQEQPSVFTYSLPSPGKVSLHILDLAGDLVREIVPRKTAKVAGIFSEEWDGQDVSGRFAGAGLYVYVFKYESDDGKTHALIRKPVGLVRK